MYSNANVIIKNTKDESSNVLAYLNPGLSDEKMREIGYKIEKIPGVSKNGVKFRSVDEAIERAQSISNILVEGYTREELEMIYQPCFIVTFDNVDMVPVITSNLRSIDGIGTTEDDIRVNPYALKAQRDAKISKIISITVMILIVEFSILLMMNTTKLMMYAKRREISIMKYVGARDNFIKTPFAIQGVITALVAVAITMLIVFIIYPIIVSSIDKLGSGYTYVDYAELSTGLMSLLLVIGCSIGIIGSISSMNKYLDV